jgi:hypothetical protein
LSAASGQAKRRTRNIHNRKKRNSNMKTMMRFLVVSRQSRAKIAAVALAGLLGALLGVSDAMPSPAPGVRLEPAALALAAPSASTGAAPWPWDVMATFTPITAARFATGTTTSASAPE